MSEQTRRRDARLARFALLAVIAWFVLCAIASAYVQGSLWDLRAYHEDPIDSAWRLELSWLAWRGEWSGFAFHYPRGPLWQLFGWTAASASGGDGPWTLATLYLLFHLATIALAVYLVVRAVSGPWARVAALFAIGLLTNASGVATLRGFVPLLVVFAYLPPPRSASADPPNPRRAWLDAGAAGTWTALAALLSFDRLYVIGLSIATVFVVELSITRWARGETSRAWSRLGRYLAASTGAAGIVVIAMWIAGGDPVEAVLAQRELAGAYASAMSTEWRIAVPQANVIALFVVCAAIIVLPQIRARAPSPRLAPLWLAGALPAAAFALVRADEGHMIVSMIPALAVLALIAAGADRESSALTRTISGALTAVAIVGWFGTYPDNLAGHPAALAEARAVARGLKRADTEYRTDHGAALAYARDETRDDTCLAVSSDVTLLHPMLDARGPTELSLRWNEPLKRRLAERIERARCPHFIYSIRNYDEPGHSWPFGADFVTVARMYELERPIGAAMLGMRLRETPRSIERVDLLADRDERDAPNIAVPGSVRVQLPREVRGTDLVELELELEYARWRQWAGGTPALEWRFENDGAAVSDWRPLWHIGVGHSIRVQVAADPEAAEWYWMSGRTPPFERRADALAIRLAPRGISTPGRVALRVRRVEMLRAAAPSGSPPMPTTRSQCDGSVDLVERLREGAGFARFVAPSPERRYFNLEPAPPNRKLAEVLFPITACPDSCYVGRFVVAAAEGESDGVEAELHVIDPPERVLLRRLHIPAGGDEYPVELPLERWAGREVFLRIGTRFGASYDNDDAKVVAPQITRCRARVSVAAALGRGEGWAGGHVRAPRRRSLVRARGGAGSRPDHGHREHLPSVRGARAARGRSGRLRGDGVRRRRGDGRGARPDRARGDGTRRGVCRAARFPSGAGSTSCCTPGPRDRRHRPSR